MFLDILSYADISDDPNENKSKRMRIKLFQTEIELRIIDQLKKDKPPIIFTTAFLLFSFIAECQCTQKIVFHPGDSTGGYYLAIPPVSKIIRGTLVLFCPYKK